MLLRFEVSDTGIGISPDTLGKIFDPRQHTLPNNCASHAQSPQALVCEWGVRFYFSTRVRDAAGMYVSHIAYADFAPDLKTLLGVSQSTVIPLGGAGCFDEHGIFPVNILDLGHKILGFTTGWSRRCSVSAESSIGLTVSEDGGNTFARHGDGPVMSSSLHEPFLVADAFALQANNVYHMYYIFGLRWTQSDSDTQPERVYKIAHATSTDAITWERNATLLIPDRLHEDECQALPTVFRHEGRWHMYFCFRERSDFRTGTGKGYRLGYAHSSDMLNWVRDDENAGISCSDTGWDSEMMCYPTVFSFADKTYLAYNGNEFGKAGFGLAVLDE